MAQPHWYPIAIARFRQPDGTLSVVEAGDQLPFVVKRVFWLTGIPDADVRRGAHAHEALRQVLFCSSGSCEIDLEARSGETASLTLSEAGDALYLDGQVWRTMRNFSPDCCLMVLCDREYAHDRVIRDRGEFAGR
jgi:hypothetical protein